MTGLSARIGTRVGDFQLDIELEIPSTGVTGLFGASGSGKTTILRCLAGLHRPERAVVRFNDEVWQSDSVFVPAHHRSVGYVSQDADLFPHLTVRDNLRYAHRRVPQGNQNMTWDAVVQWTALQPILDRAVPNLSGGERQRAAIARALLASPRVLLMDEPVSALDEPARREVLDRLTHLLAKLAIPVVYVSHSLNEVARLANHLAWVGEGRIRDTGPVSRVLGRLDFARWVGDEAGVVLEGAIRDHDEQFHLTTVTTPLGPLTIPQRPDAPGVSVRVQINARDVSVGLTAQESSSILNEFPVTVLDIAEHSASDCLLRLGRDDAAVVIARITRKSLAQLELTKGREIYARVKSVAVLD